MTLKLTSPAFSENDEIPARYTGEGEDISPPLAWSGVPTMAKSLALIVDDPDAPDPEAPKKVWVHWVLFDIPLTASGLEEGVQKLPPGTRMGMNDSNKTAYHGPMPPIGRHRYYFKLYALEKTLDLPGTPTKAEVERAMQGHILSQAVLMGTYQLKKK